MCTWTSPGSVDAFCTQIFIIIILQTSEIYNKNEEKNKKII